MLASLQKKWAKEEDAYWENTQDVRRASKAKQITI